MRLIYTPHRSQDIFSVDEGKTFLADGESTEVSRARGEELLARHPGKFMLSPQRDRSDTSTPSHSPQPDTAPDDSTEE